MRDFQQQEHEQHHKWMCGQEQDAFYARQKKGRDEYDNWRHNIMAPYNSGGSGGGSGLGWFVLGFIIIAAIGWLSSLPIAWLFSLLD